MKILFVANHGRGDNEDEDAVTFALRQLGHKVTCVQEKRRNRLPSDHDALFGKNGYDFCLCFKWPTISEVREVKCPVVYWHFDLIDGTFDPTLRARSIDRMNWVKDMLQYVRLGFHTDGDWVAKDKTGKLRWLMQGADERVAGFGVPIYKEGQLAYPDILFTGMINHGQTRANHIERLRNRYKEQFSVLGDCGPRYRKHGRELANIFATTKVVVAPDGPSSDRYWSNRVWLTLSLGGFLLHPLCRGLERYYNPDEIETYESRNDLEYKINWYLVDSKARERYRMNGYRATMERNLYRHRCIDLIKEVERVL